MEFVEEYDKVNFYSIHMEDKELMVRWFWLIKR